MMKKTIITMITMLAVAVGFAGDSVPFLLDTVTTSTSPVVDSLSISWDAAWIGGDSGATVVIADNGTEVRRATGEGEFTHILSGGGRHEITYTTLIGGMPQDEVYAITVYTATADPKYVVAFDANGGAGAMPAQTFQAGVAQPLTANAFTYTGHTFAGWATNANGNVVYADGASIAPTGDLALYAVWTDGAYSVHGKTYSADDIVYQGYIGDAYSFANDENYLGRIVFVHSKSGERRADVVTPWGTYELHDVVSSSGDINSNVGFFRCTMRSSGGDELCLELDLAAEWDDDEGITRNTYFYEASTRTRYYECSGQRYVFGEEGPARELLRNSIGTYYLAIDHSQDAPGWEGHEFYQTTSPETAALTVTVDESGVAKVHGTVDGIAISAEHICTCSGGDSGVTRLWLDIVHVLEPGKVAYIEGVFSPDSHEMPWAWIEILHVSPASELVLVTFNANGGAGTMETQTFQAGVAQPLTTNAFTYTGHTFAGWATNASGNVVYADGASITPTGDLALYAVWAENPSNVSFFIEDGVLTAVDLNGETEVVIPNGVTSIGDYTFEDCGGLTSVTIPASVTNIGSMAFGGCSSLTNIVFVGNAPKVAEYGFAGLPDGVVAHIHTDATGFDSQQGKWNGIALVYIEAVPFMTFGDTYAYHNTVWGTDGYFERDIKKANFIPVYADEVVPNSGIFHTHMALFEVFGVHSKDEIRPVVENLGFNGTLTAAVWADEELRSAVLPPPSTADDWESGGRSIDYREPGDISGPGEFSYDPEFVYEYESDNCECNWPQNLWPDNNVVDGRFWVTVECKASEIGRWGGVNGGFRVWQSGTGIKSEQMYATYTTEGSWPCATNLPTLFRGLPLENFDRYGFDIEIWDVIHVAYGVPLHGYWMDATPEKPGAPLSITLPEAGILYMTAYDEDLEDIVVENADSVERESVSWDQYNAMEPECYFYEYCSSYNNRSVLAVKVNSAKTIRLAQEDDFNDYGFNRLQFFPSASKAVAVEASFVSIFDKNRYPRRSNNVGEYLQGYVTGTGVYKVGETVALTAVSAPGEEFDHWELKYGNFPSGINTNSPTLNFAVTDACAGTAEERKQMVVRAVWKATRQIVATTENIAAGHAEGSGFYHDGAAVTLTARPAEGYEFDQWSDGVMTAVRTVYVSGDAEYTARFTPIQTCPIEDVLGRDRAWTSYAEGEASADGYADSTATGGMAVKFTAADEASAWVETVVTNACRVTFDWKSSCEGLVKGKPYDYLAFAVDGEQQGFICGEVGWTSATNYVTGAGEHVLRWTFQRDEDGSAGEDCAWLANVKVAPSVTLTFADGGAPAGTVPEPVTAYADERIVLPGRGSLAWPKHTFLGWNDGVNTYAAGAEYSIGDAAVAGRPPCLTAAWTANTLSAPVITAPETYEGDSAIVTITADGGATIFYTTDGTEPGVARSESAPYQWIPATSSTIQYQGSFAVVGSATIKAIAVKDDYFDSAVASAIMTRLIWTFGEYLNWPEQAFTTGGDASWTRVKGVSADGYALRSGAITHSQTSRLETVVSGPGAVTFSCKVAGEIVKKTVYDGLAFCIDGVQQGELMGNANWAEQTFEVTGEGLHTLSWLYVKDDGDMIDVGEDCAWVDAVTWTPAGGSGDTVVDMGGGKSVTVPGDWLTNITERIEAEGGDVVAALQSTAANRRMSVAECYVMGVDPEVAEEDFKITSITIGADGKPVVEFDPPQAEWNVPSARAVLKGAAELGGEWQTVTDGNKAGLRFFKVVVELP